MKHDRPLILVSSCLLGNKVRYNGGHTINKWMTETLSKYVEFYPICPELEMGLGVPREEVHLEYDKEDGSLKMIGRSGKDYTERAKGTLEFYRKTLSNVKIAGMILQKKSPSCGLERVKHFNPDSGMPDRYGKGIFAEFLSKEFPHIPKIDSGRFYDDEERDHFLRQVYCTFRFQKMAKNTNGIQEFHRQYKYLLMSHNQNLMRQMGRIAADHRDANAGEKKEEYQNLLTVALSIRPTPENGLNTFQHLMGYFKKKISPKEKEYIHKIFDDFKNKRSNFNEADRLIHYLADNHNVDYLKEQFYFNPFPAELSFRG